MHVAEEAVQVDAKFMDCKSKIENSAQKDFGHSRCGKGNQMGELANFSETEIRDFNELEASFLKSASILKREYLNNLTTFQTVGLPKDIESKKMSDYVRFYKFTKLVYNQDESFIEKLTTIARAAHICNCSIATVISGEGGDTSFWVGLINKNNEEGLTPDLTDTLKGSIEGNFHGSKVEPVGTDATDSKLDGLKEYKIVSAVSNIASLRDEDGEIERYVQGIEKLIDSLHGKKYTVLTIADPVSNQESTLVQDSLEQLYSQLSGFAKTDMSMNETSSVSNSEQYSKNYTKSIGTNTSVSQSHTNQTGWSDSNSYTEGKTSNKGAVAVGIAGVAAMGLMVATGGIAAVAGAAIAGVAASGAAAAGAMGAAAIKAAGSVAGGLIGSNHKSQTKAHGESGGMADTTARVDGTNENYAEGDTETSGYSKTLGAGRTLSFSVENRTVKSILDSIDTQIERLKECGSYGAFSSCTYIMSDNIGDNMLASSIFNALISGENSNIQVAKVNTWGIEDSGNDVKEILGYMSKLTHPGFKALNSEMIFTPASLVSGKELSIQMGFPKKSIQGVSVVYKVPFGRNVIRASKVNRALPIGKLYNLGEIDAGNIELDLDSLTSHLFVTGSTGTGKSNTIYKLLEQIHDIDAGIHFMVIEPAKGEYKHAFYKHPRIMAEVYGTNPKKMKLLKINPFSFPEDIHILEHIDRLVEILNVCWPMYAAMPAILKNAVIKSYESCGWDMTNSFNKKRVFPCFADVLENINVILNTSAFSKDNKGDYIGALCTRVESLMVGINGQIFTSEELSDDDLFNRNVIVDLSRVGAMETKSLIMGILVMKLQEYRMAEEFAPNQRLRHIVVMEEAHNLLKKTSMEQSAESGNLIGKSVEMITNAIAEMRTYGEGFFVVDQAPNLLDTAVIRNTNTKIVLRLPEHGDREIVGKSMALSDEQIFELSKLEKGCAAVYQNDWEEAILCQFEQYHKDYRNIELDKELYKYDFDKRIITQSEIKKDILCFMINTVIDEVHNYENDRPDIEKMIAALSVSYSVKKNIHKVLFTQKKNSMEDIVLTAIDLYDAYDVFKKVTDSRDYEEWNENILCNIDPELRKMDLKYISVFIHCLMINHTNKNPEFKATMEKWKAHMREAY